MIQVDILRSADPILKLLRSRPHEIFNKPFPAYALFLFGAADEGVATWFARTLVSLDSLTGDDVACLIFAKKAKLRARKERVFGYWAAHVLNSRQDYAEFDLDSVSPYDGASTSNGYDEAEDFSASYIVDEERRSLWRQTEEDLTVVTYTVDEVAAALGVTASLPCIVFFDSVLSSSPALTNVANGPMAVLPLQDQPSNDVIRFFRRSIQRFRATLDFARYQALLDMFVETETWLKANAVSSVRRIEQAIAECASRHLASVARLERLLPQLREYVGGGSLKHIRRTFELTPEIDKQSLPAIESKILENKPQLTRLSKTIHSVEYYITLAQWPLVQEDVRRVRVVAETYVSEWRPDCDPKRFASDRNYCKQVLEDLARVRTELIGACLAALPDVSAIKAKLDNNLTAERAVLVIDLERAQSTIEHRTAELHRMQEAFSSDGRPSLIRAVQEELAEEQKRLLHHSSISVMMVDRSVNKTIYNVEKAGAVGPNAAAQHTSFT